MVRVAVDIDGVIASKLENGNYPEDYVKKTPLKDSIEALTAMKLKSYYVYLFTARYEIDREVTEKWLTDNGFEGLYQELIMGKPKYDVLIDDRAIRHENWESTIKEMARIGETGRWF